LRHEHEQTNRFERNRLAAGIRSCDDNRARAGLWIDIDGYNRLGIEQRMARNKRMDGFQPALDFVLTERWLL
jgi:hypothetical protein